MRSILPDQEEDWWVRVHLTSEMSVDGLVEIRSVFEHAMGGSIHLSGSYWHFGNDSSNTISKSILLRSLGSYHGEAGG